MLNVYNYTRMKDDAIFDQSWIHRRFTTDTIQLESYYGDCVIGGMSEIMTGRSYKPKKIKLLLNGTTMDIQRNNDA